MTVGNLAEWAAVIVAGVAAFVSWRQARRAQQSAREADRARSRAVEALEGATDAQARIAQILEDAARPPADQWTLERVGTQGLRLTNNTRENRTHVKLTGRYKGRKTQVVLRAPVLAAGKCETWESLPDRHVQLEAFEVDWDNCDQTVIVAVRTPEPDPG